MLSVHYPRPDQIWLRAYRRGENSVCNRLMARDDLNTVGELKAFRNICLLVDVAAFPCSFRRRS